jgi:hypothetical protein
MPISNNIASAAEGTPLLTSFSQRIAPSSRSRTAVTPASLSQLRTTNPSSLNGRVNDYRKILQSTLVVSQTLVADLLGLLPAVFIGFFEYAKAQIIHYSTALKEVVVAYVSSIVAGLAALAILGVGAYLSVENIRKELTKIWAPETQQE